MSYNRENNIKTFAASIVLVVVIAAFAVAGFLLFGGEAPAKEDEYPWIVSDESAKNGMLDGTFYEGEKNPAGRLSYKIAGEITVSKEDGKGNFKIENSGKNSCLIKVKIIINEETIYETGYLKPNQHIGTDAFDTIPKVGTYEAEAIFEGFDPNTEESIGAAKEEIIITVLP
ncbi:MAG: hypothetical protein IJO22_08715 [Oscillospiraceae bacterium]|nr:hypothetical protein [Oscillospiraceae bacterium]